MRAKFRQATCPVDAKAINLILGQRIVELRKQIGMTQADLAKQIGVSFQQVQKYENGINQISVPKLIQIASALGTSSGCLLRDLS